MLSLDLFVRLVRSPLAKLLLQGRPNLVLNLGLNLRCKFALPALLRHARLQPFAVLSIAGCLFPRMALFSQGTLGGFSIGGSGVSRAATPVLTLRYTPGHAGRSMCSRAG